MAMGGGVQDSLFVEREPVFEDGAGAAVFLKLVEGGVDGVEEFGVGFANGPAEALFGEEELEGGEAVAFVHSGEPPDEREVRNEEINFLFDEGVGGVFWSFELLAFAAGEFLLDEKITGGGFEDANGAFGSDRKAKEIFVSVFAADEDGLTDGEIGFAKGDAQGAGLSNGHAGHDDVSAAIGEVLDLIFPGDFDEFDGTAEFRAEGFGEINFRADQFAALFVNHGWKSGSDSNAERGCVRRIGGAKGNKRQEKEPDENKQVMWFHAGDLVVSFGAEVNDEI